MNKSVIIICAGIAGLSAGYIAQMDGQITILALAAAPSLFSIYRYSGEGEDPV